MLKPMPSARRMPVLAGAAAVLAACLVTGAAQAANPCPKATHSGQNFSGQDLKDRNFANQNLTGANFTNANLQGAVLTGAILKQADFTGATLGKSATSGRVTSFSRADLTEACFAGTTVLATDFQFADLTCTVFDNTELALALFGPVIKAASPSGSCRTAFTNSTMNCEFIPQWKDLDLTRARVQVCFDKMSGIDYSNGRMEGVIFSGINLNDTRWVGTSLRAAFFLNAKLKNAVLSNADLRLAQLSQANATGAKLDQVRLSGAHLSGATLQAADLRGAVLQAADLLPAADLSLAFMPDAILTDAKMTGVNLSHANFYGASAKADNATMQQVDFTNANLGSVNLTQGRLKGARMDAADLVNAVFVGADLTPTTDLIASSLVQANLQGADFTGAQLAGANLSNAAVALADGVRLFKAPASLSADLDRRELSAEVVEAFTGKGYRLVDCEDPSVLLDEKGKRWQIWLTIAVGPSGSRFRKFGLALSGATITVTGLSTTEAPKTLFTIPGTYAATLDKKLLASGLLSAFRTNGFALPPCFNPSINVKTAGSSWDLGEALSLITVAGLGYTRYGLKTAGVEIQVSGAEITVIRPDASGSLTLVPLPVQPTKLAASAFNDSTTCPNQKSYGANVASGTSWEDMMTAVAPPPPPSCIPSPTSWCPGS